MSIKPYDFTEESTFIELTEKQLEALDRCKKNRSFGVFFDMGTGKTVIMLSLIDYLVFETMEVDNVLIIAPPQIIGAHETWQTEIKKWKNYEFFDFVELTGTPKQRMKKKNTKCSIHFLNNTLIDWYEKTYKTLNDYDMIIIDESDTFKDSTTNRFKAIKKMINHEKHRVYLLTGTPRPNCVSELWAQAFLLDGGERLGTSFYKFRHTYGYKINNFKWFYSKANEKHIHDLLSDISMFDENTDKLPPFNKIVKKIPFESEKKKEQYKHFVDSYVLRLQQGVIVATEKTNVMNKALQLANGNVYTDKNGNYEVFDSGKLKAVLKYIEENPDRNILIYYHYISDREELMKAIPHAVHMNKDSANEIKLWNKGKIKVAIMNPASMGRGGNLQFGGYTMIWYGLTYSLAYYLQAIKRLWRNGQEHPVDCLFFLREGTLDMTVYEALINKNKKQRAYLEKIQIKIMKGEKVDVYIS